MTDLLGRRNLTRAAAGRVVRAGGKREFDNEGPNVHESLRMLGGKPATELREFPEVVAKRKRGEAVLDDDDEAGGASTRAAVDVGAKATPARGDDDGEDVGAGPRTSALAGGLVGAHRADGADDAGAHSARRRRRRRPSRASPPSTGARPRTPGLRCEDDINRKRTKAL